jgi:hypothetical protein
VFAKIGFDGSATWHDRNEKPSYLPNNADDWLPLPADVLVFSHSTRHWISAADWCSLGESISQLGGHPTWIQDAYYPECPECESLMAFIAQLAVEDVDEYGEGIYYMHVCRKCGVAATHYQQS